MIDRIRLKVLHWDKPAGRGIVLDGTGFRFEISSAHLEPECDGYLEQHEIVSAVPLGTTVTEVFVESGNRAIKERKPHESYVDVGKPSLPLDLHYDYRSGFLPGDRS